MRDSEASQLKPRDSQQPDPPSRDDEAQSGVLPKATAIDDDWLDKAVTIPAPKRASIQPIPVLAIGPPVEPALAPEPDAAPTVDSAPAEASASADAVDVAAPTERAPEVVVVADPAPVAAAEPDASSESTKPNDEKPVREAPANPAEALEQTPARSAASRSTRPEKREHAVERSEPAAVLRIPTVPILLVAATIGAMVVLHRSRPAFVSQAELAPTAEIAPTAATEPPIVEPAAPPSPGPVVIAAPAAAAQRAASSEMAQPALPSDVAQPRVPPDPMPRAVSAGPTHEDAPPAAADESARLSAYRAVVLAGTRARNCRFRGDGAATIPVVVTFAADGVAHGVILRREIANPMTRDCITSKFTALSIPASGAPVTVSTDVTLR